MSLKKSDPYYEKEKKVLHINTRKRDIDVVDRFISVLWRREVDLKFTTK